MRVESGRQYARAKARLLVRAAVLTPNTSPDESARAPTGCTFLPQAVDRYLIEPRVMIVGIFHFNIPLSRPEAAAVTDKR